MGATISTRESSRNPAAVSRTVYAILHNINAAATNRPVSFAAEVALRKRRDIPTDHAVERVESKLKFGIADRSVSKGVEKKNRVHTVCFNFFLFFSIKCTIKHVPRYS